MIALTFADALSPSKTVTKKEGYNAAAYFEERLEIWKVHIREVLATRINLGDTVIEQIKLNPTTSDREEELPNGKEWYISFWLDVLEVLPPAALMKFLDIHKNNISFGDDTSRKMPEWPENFTLPPPPQTEDSDPPPYSQAVLPTAPTPPQEPSQAIAKELTSLSISVSNQAPVTVNPSITVQNEVRSKSNGDSDDGRISKPFILLEGENRDRFENTVGEAVWSAATAGGIAGATVATAAGIVAGTVAAPVVIAGAAIGAVGAGVTKLLGWW